MLQVRASVAGIKDVQEPPRSIVDPSVQSIHEKAKAMAMMTNLGGSAGLAQKLQEVEAKMKENSKQNQVSVKQQQPPKKEDNTKKIKSMLQAFKQTKEVKTPKQKDDRQPETPIQILRR
jgi:hypothetical protein